MPSVIARGDRCERLVCRPLWLSRLPSRSWSRWRRLRLLLRGASASPDSEGDLCRRDDERLRRVGDNISTSPTALPGLRPGLDGRAPADTGRNAAPSESAASASPWPLSCACRNAATFVDACAGGASVVPGRDAGASLAGIDCPDFPFPVPVTGRRHLSSSQDSRQTSINFKLEPPESRRCHCQ